MKVIHGNNIEILKQYPDNYFDAIVTDCPYGLGKEPNAEALMKDWIEKGYHEIQGSGFMGKEWDAFVPQPIFWKEVFRVLKHGGHVLAFYGTRTYDWGVMAMRFAGFEVRDCIQWLYGSGFPKSHNISKAIDKMYGAEREILGISKNSRPNSERGNGLAHNDYGKTWNETITLNEQAKQWDGWGSALKPANEPIVLARKPLEKGLSIAENVLKWGVGAINIDGCRVGFKNESDNRVGTNAKYSNTSESDFFKGIKNNQQVYDSQGRFPANLILTHHPECECVGTKKVKPSNGSGKASEKGGGFSKGMFGDGTSDNIGGGFTDENGEETIEDWNCHEDCPIKILDEQSGELKSGKPLGIKKASNGYGGNYGEIPITGFGDKGGASRFFKQCNFEENVRFQYIAKASKSERNKGLDGFENKPPMYESHRANYENTKGIETPYAGAGRTGNENRNNHPTVKPIKLMQYLVRLITPPNGIVLDPFCGSGTTGIACKLEGFDFVGLEQDAEYCKIAQARIDNYKEESVNKKNSNNTDEQSNDKQLNLF
jgi:site-specific DNA-methyltransferase (adenine-specific)